ncbi:hypothetical protein LTR84_000165 [Exophiala bonariae]|uniref:Choline monooxygenase, chloroplastic n=1 Tax=Exophiala bonariae TaxID=1690606 RepID=A0AAV9NQ77_9EURO|nr:hypothetical protein LTR84_000165 [Exophiala bonariae]
MAVLQKTLPATWYTSDKYHKLERKAVFLRSWFFLGTVNKFKTGQAVGYEIAQVKLTARGEDLAGEITVRVFFDQNGEEVQSHQTRSGLVFTTISSDAPSFNEFFPGLEELLESYDFKKLPHRRKLHYTGKYNWKTMIDGFQECLHCQYCHPGLSKLYPTETYHVVNHQNWSRHYSDPKFEDDGLFLYFFPNTTLNLYNGGMSSFRACPSPEVGVSRMEFDYYNDNSADEFEVYYKFVREVADEDGNFEPSQRDWGFPLSANRPQDGDGSA